MRRKHEMIKGHPISVWDDGGETADRYSVVFLDTEQDGKVDYLAMSGAPFHPQGFCQHGSMPLSLVAYRGRGGCFKKRIAFADLPEDCRKAVENDLKSY